MGLSGACLDPACVVFLNVGASPFNAKTCRLSWKRRPEPLGQRDSGNWSVQTPIPVQWRVVAIGGKIWLAVARPLHMPQDARMAEMRKSRRDARGMIVGTLYRKLDHAITSRKAVIKGTV